MLCKAGNREGGQFLMWGGDRVVNGEECRCFELVWGAAVLASVGVHTSGGWSVLGGVV